MCILGIEWLEELCLLSGLATTCGLLGCSGSGASSAAGANASTGQVTLEDLPTEYAEAYCSWLYRCCPSEQLAHFADAPIAFTGNTEDECRTNMAALLTLAVPEITESESQGRSRYSPAGAATCIQQARASCVDIGQACTDIIVPLVPTGGACSADSECVDQPCIGETGDADGACGPLQPLGAPCGGGDDCASGRCYGSTCGNQLPDGQACQEDNVCVSQYCDFEAGECAPVPYAGACDI